MIDPVALFGLMLRASLFSSGGMGNLPALHDDLIRRNWADEHSFGEALAVGQVTPGPNGLWVVSLGYLADGLRGALLATVAITIPPLLVLALDRLVRRALGEHPAMEGFTRGLSLAVVGTFLVVLVQLLRGVGGLDIVGAVILGGSLALGSIRRVPVVAVLALAALAGIALY